MRYVYATLVIQREDQKQDLLDHINNIDPESKFTVEGSQQNGSIPFLNTLVKPEALSITVYRNPMHTDQYLQWDSHHNLTAKDSVVSTLTHRPKVVCTRPEHLTKEKQHLRRALTEFKYPKWALDKVERKINNQEDMNTQGDNPEEATSNPSSNTTVRTQTRKNKVKVT